MRLAERYRKYIACLNRRDWTGLGDFVSQDVKYNDQPVGLAVYRDMLISNVEEIPDLKFKIGILLVEDAMVASRLVFDCTPIGSFIGIPVNGRPVSFTENVFYQFDGGKIEAVWSVIDKAAIEAQLTKA